MPQWQWNLWWGGTQKVSWHDGIVPCSQVHFKVQYMVNRKCYINITTGHSESIPLSQVLLYTYNKGPYIEVSQFWDDVLKGVSLTWWWYLMGIKPVYSLYLQRVGQDQYIPRQYNATIPACVTVLVLTGPHHAVINSPGIYFTGILNQSRSHTSQRRTWSMRTNHCAIYVSTRGRQIKQIVGLGRNQWLYPRWWLFTPRAGSGHQSTACQSQ